jgi:heme exporter protein A
VNENLVLTQHLNLTNPASIDTTLALLQLSAYKHQLTKHLSAGQKRRVALAKLFLFPKPIWILDEPLTALDINTQQLFLSQLDGHLKQGGMAIISSHHTLTVQAPTKKLRLIA